MVLRRIAPWSLAKILATIYGGLGLVFGVIVALASIVGAGFAHMSEAEEGMPAFMGALFGVGAIVFLPLLYGLLGLVIGAIGAALYNLGARFVGGVQVELVESPSATPM
jgi:hypothetical protein